MNDSRPQSQSWLSGASTTQTSISAAFIRPRTRASRCELARRKPYLPLRAVHPGDCNHRNPGRAGRSVVVGEGQMKRSSPEPSITTARYKSPVNFPFIATAPDGVYTLKKGTPLVQAIPFRRADAALEGSIRAESKREGEERERIHRSTLAGEGWYKRRARAPR